MDNQEIYNPVKEISEIITAHGSSQDRLIPLLHAVHEKYNYLPEDALKTLSSQTGIPLRTILSTATFYSSFRFRPSGRHRINICTGTACYIRGAEKLYDDFKKHLNISAGNDTDEEGLFTVDKVACLGCCMLAPAVQIDDIIYGHVTKESIPGVLRDFLHSFNQQPGPTHSVSDSANEIRICLCSSCKASGSGDVYNELSREISAQDLPVRIKQVSCTGISFQTPIVDIALAGGGNFRYGMVRKGDGRKILSRHFSPQKLTKKISLAIDNMLEYLYTGSEDLPVTRFLMPVRDESVMEYTEFQKHIVTLGAGVSDPLDFSEYRRNDGFAALEKCLADPDKIQPLIKESKLRGRGGGGFETAVKWEIVKNSTEEIRYLICNGDEGDPGAFMDRMVLESFPFRALEGALIAAVACGIHDIYFFIRVEYPLALERIKSAVEICRNEGIIGSKILGYDYEINIHIAESAGAFVCGEETALIESIQGERGTPRIRPPYPAISGLWGKPTLVNNVETLSLVPWIINNGSAGFLSMGEEKSRGTKCFALAGKISRGGLIEVEMGITLRDVIYKIGGGIQNGKKLKAVQIGGPSGGCIPESLIDTPVDYESLVSRGAIMGSGGMIVLDEDDCMVEIARYFMSFTQLEACGKCTYGRTGTKRILELLEKFIEGKAVENDLERLEELACQVKNGSMCGLCKAAPNPVLSTLRYFRDEYIAHINGKCPAKKCKTLIQYSINDKCIGCTRCAQRCPADAIEIKPYKKHEIDQSKCTKCDACRTACAVGAVDVE